MKIMVLDIETDGKYTIVEIAYNIYEYIDNKLILEREVDIIINDNETLDYYKKIPLSMIKTGVPPKDAILQIYNDIQLVEYITCHNVNFDIRFIKNYMKKYDLELEFPKLLDTMRESKFIVNAKNKNNIIKMPKLEELYVYLFNRLPDLEACHRGNYDVKITGECLEVLLQQNIIKL